MFWLDFDEKMSPLRGARRQAALGAIAGAVGLLVALPDQQVNGIPACNVNGCSYFLNAKG
jgi:hypothetical protein